MSRLPTTDFLATYAPKTLNEFVGNRGVVKTMVETLKKHPSQVLVVGPTGSGKTTLCKLILDTLDLDVLHINGNETDDVKNLKRLVENFCTNRTIESFFSKKKKLVFFDDVDILLTCDRNVGGFLTTFLDNAIKNCSISVLMTCSISEEKRLTELKKKVTYVRLANPFAKDTFVYTSGVLDTEDVEYDPTKLLKLIETFNGNIRNVFNNLHQLALSDDELKQEKQTRITFDCNVFDVMKKVLKHRMTAHDFVIISDNNLVPLLVYENYVNEMFKNKYKQKNSVYITVFNDVISNFIHAEILEQHMYQYTDWSFYNLISILKCGYINHHLNRLETKKTGTYDGYIFTQLLTKSALRCNYNKRMTLIKQSIGVSEVEHIYFLLDCLAQELKCKNNIKPYRGKLAQLLGVSQEDTTTICSYFSQFMAMEKSLLSKIKK